MTNEIVKQDAQEVQAVSGYEAFREQCAKVCNEHAQGQRDFAQHSEAKVADFLAATIRALPLPEVKQEPVAWFRDLKQEPISDRYKKARKDDFYKHHTIPCYLLPPDAAALRKENEQLRQRIAELENDSRRYQWLKNEHTWSIEETLANGTPLSSTNKFVNRITKDYSELTSEWSLTFYSDYGLREYEDDLDKVIDAALKGGAA